ncbi:uncharacterized protein Dvar_07690 [Desulfosarcina variabilis str. Montpellier]|uniref:periplasmic heavy metal sensor n=1 Tax=Desulfosarcina variabilis TaxID=2300 RepID=UPI003AFA7069
MRLFHKRLLILFSVALNIGFVIMAIVMMAQHHGASRNRSYRAIVDIVQQLNLPEDQQRTVLKTIEQFRETLDQHNQNLKAARSNIVRRLAVRGPVDRSQLHPLTNAIGAEEKLKNEAFEAHFMDLRNQLGNEKGAEFFSLLLAHFDTKDKTHHP